MNPNSWNFNGIHGPANPYGRSPSENIPDRGGGQGSYGDQQPGPDELLARQMQAQFDAGAYDMGDQPGSIYDQQQQYTYGTQAGPSTFAGAHPPQYVQHSVDVDTGGSHSGPFSTYPNTKNEPFSSLSATDYSQMNTRDPVADENAIKRLAQVLFNARCKNCHSILIPALDSIRYKEGRKKFGVVFSTFTNAKTGGPKSLTSAIECSNCQALTCVGCGRKASNCSFFCKNSRVFVIWAILCGSDHIRDRGIKEAKVRESAQRGSRMHVKGAGTGYGDGRRSELPDFPTTPMPSPFTFHPMAAANAHFGTFSYQRAFRQPGDNLEQRDKKAKEWDNTMENILRMLTYMLPTTTQQTSFDTAPPSTLNAMLLRSSILDTAAALLRNDSLEDMSKRGKLYSSLFDFVSALADHPSTAPTVVDVRVVREKDGNLLRLSFDPTLPDGDGNRADSHPPIAECIQNIGVQSAVILKNAQKSKDIDSAFLGSCKRISDLANKLKPYDGQGNTLLVAGRYASDEKSDEKWHKEHSVSDVPDKLIFNLHHFSNAARKLSGTQPGRVKKLVMEVASMQTSLPEGIFVRHASTRLDVMKVLIVGPRDTPYENGLYEFDLFCGEQYPNAPPQVFFRGIAGPTNAINPNLHPDGKVCLSLLGTWPGDPWQPGKSTIYQVVVSIQSMIFCEDPWYNEPGMETLRSEAPGPYNTSARASQDYNRKIRGMTIAYGMLKWFKKKSHIWEDVVQHHWMVNAGRTLDTVKKWAYEESSFGSQPDLRTLNPLLKVTFTGGGKHVSNQAMELEKALRPYTGRY